MACKLRLGGMHNHLPQDVLEHAVQVVALAGNSRLRFEAARGSLYEARAGLLVGVAWGYLSTEAAAAALEPIRLLGGRVYGLARR